MYRPPTFSVMITARRDELDPDDVGLVVFVITHVPGEREKDSVLGKEHGVLYERRGEEHLTGAKPCMRGPGVGANRSPSPHLPST